MSVSVAKYDAAGNTFLIADDAGVPEETKGAWAEAACDERQGLATDGALFTLPTLHGLAAARVFNRDGSEAEISLNGLRCVVAHHLLEGGEAPERVGAAAGTWRVETATLAGPAAQVALSRAWEGAPSPQVGEGDTVGWRVKGVGNPHLVVPVESQPAEEVFWERGPALAAHPAFPHGANVHFVARTGPDQARIRTWERGVGPTLSCGSGALAAAWWLACEHGEPAWELTSEGGTLAVTFAGGRVLCAGLARRVARARLDSA